MIKRREPMSRDLLRRRKFDWQLAGKIAKFEGKLRGMRLPSLPPSISLLFPSHLLAFYGYLLARPAFFSPSPPQRPVYFPRREKHSSFSDGNRFS